MHLRLNRTLPLALNVEAGAAETRVDLTHLRVSNLALNTGAADTRIWLPEASGFTSMHVYAGLARVRIDVPRGVAVDIDASETLGTRAIDDMRFPSLGNGHYRSPDYDTATNRVQMRLEVGLGDVSVR